MRRIFRIAIGFTLAGVVGVACLAAVTFWRVRRGPVSLDFLVPRVEAELGGGDPTSAVRLDGLDLVWDGVDRQVELRARGLRVGEVASAPAAFDAMRLRLRARSLLRGRVYVQSIEVDGPRLQLVRDATGRLDLQARTTAGEVRDLGDVWSLVGRLETVVVQGGRIDLIDAPSGTRWVIPRVDARVWRDREQLRGAVELSVVSGDTVIPVAVGVTYSWAERTLEAQATSSGAETGAAFGAWPSSLAPEARAWVTGNVRDGRITAARLELRGRLEREERSKVVVDALHADVDFEGLTVRYLDTMPPVTGVRGQAQFGREGVVIPVRAGTLERLAVAPATVHVAWPPGAPNRITIDASVQGPLASAVAVLDHEPVALGTLLGVQTRGIAGEVEGRVRLAFPLDTPPRGGALGLRASARITDVVVPYGAGDWDVGNGDLTLAVSDRSVALEGTAALRGAPVRLRYRERFGHARARRLELVGSLERSHREALGIDPGAWLDGPIDARVRMAPDREGRTRADVDLDLTPAAIESPVLRLAKAPGTPGRAVLRLGVARGLVTAVERGELVSSGLTVRGTAVRPASGGPWSRIDAILSFAPDDPIEEPAGAEIALRAEDAGWRTTITSRDVGRLLRRYGYDTVRGGHMTLDGVADLSAPGVPFDGRLTVDDVTLVRVPWLVRLVSLASLRGLLDIGTQQAVVLDRIVATVGHRPPVVVVTDGVARGPKLSLTLGGTMDHGTDALDLQGTLVPSYYLLNEGAARIPVLGPAIARATGGAVQAVNFTVRGTRAEPVVAVQPLSSLAPGALRDWLRKLGL